MIFRLPSLPEDRTLRFLIILLIPLVVLLLTMGGLYYFQTRKTPFHIPTLSEILRRPEAVKPLEKVSQEAVTARRELDKEYEGLKSEFKDESELSEAEKTIQDERCLVVPTNAQDVTVGLEYFRTAESGEPNVYDYYYQARLLEVQRNVVEGCEYTQLLFLNDIKNENFSINIPKGVLTKTELGTASADVFKNHKGQTIELIIRYETKPTDPDYFKLVYWQPKRFIFDKPQF